MSFASTTRRVIVTAFAITAATIANAAPIIPEDKELFGQFYRYTEDEKLHLSEDLQGKKFKLTLSKTYLWIEAAPTPSESFETVKNRLESNSAAITDDVVAAKYIAAAKARGSTVSLYRPALTAKVNPLFPQHSEIERRRPEDHVFSTDNMLIEFGPDRSIRSFLTKIHFTTRSLFSKYDVYRSTFVNIYGGGTMARMLENKLNKADFADNHLRDL